MKKLKKIYTCSALFGLLEFQKEASYIPVNDGLFLKCFDTKALQEINEITYDVKPNEDSNQYKTQPLKRPKSNEIQRANDKQLQYMRRDLENTDKLLVKIPVDCWINNEIN